MFWERHPLHCYLVLGFPFTSPILATVFLKPTLTKVIIMVVAS